VVCTLRATASRPVALPEAEEIYAHTRDNPARAGLSIQEFHQEHILHGKAAMKTLLLLGGLMTGGMFYALTAPVVETGSLEGKWKVVAAPKDWKIAPGTNISVTKGDIQIRIGPVTGSTFHYSADLASGNIDAQKGGEKTRLGKFKLSGETVTIAVSEPGGSRPASAEASGSGVTRWAFKRTSPR